jgi:hypothetical protein
LYLKGTSWLTSVWPLMMRFSATLTRRVLRAAATLAAASAGTATAAEALAATVAATVATFGAELDVDVAAAVTGWAMGLASELRAATPIGWSATAGWSCCAWVGLDAAAGDEAAWRA